MGNSTATLQSTGSFICTTADPPTEVVATDVVVVEGAVVDGAGQKRGWASISYLHTGPARNTQHLQHFSIKYVLLHV